MDIKAYWVPAITAALFSASFSASGAVINGSFEDTAAFSGWNTIGDTSIHSNAIGIAPRDGNSMALLTTLCCSPTSVRELPYSGTNAVPSQTAELQGFFGFSLPEIIAIQVANPGRGFPRGEGSAISQTIVAGAGDVLSFDFYYLTNEAILKADSAFFTLIPVGTGTKTLLFLNPLTGSGTISPVDLCHQQVFPGPDPCGSLEFNRTTDWQHFAFAIPSAGTYTFGFGLWESPEGTVPSALFIDNVRLPEPGTAFLFALGAFFLTTRTLSRPRSKRELQQPYGLNA